MGGAVLPAELMSLLAGAFGGLILYYGHRSLRAVSICFAISFLAGIIILGSRAALFSFICGFLYLCGKKKDEHSPTPFSIYALLLLVLLILFALRPTSATGRLYIWRVCLDMIKDRPWGYGWNGFIHYYMRYQASYLSTHPDPSFQYLADNVSFPYNEYLHTLISFGFEGFIVLLVLIMNALLAKKRTPKDIVLNSLLINYLVFAFFSFPSETVYTSLLFPGFILLSSKRWLPVITDLFCVLIIVSSCVLFERREILYSNIQDICYNSDENNRVNFLREKSDDFIQFPEYRDILLSRLSQSALTDNYDLVLECANSCPNTESYCRAGDVCAMRGDLISALNYYDGAAAMVPHRIIPKYKAFCLLIDLGMFEKASERGIQLLSMNIKIKGSTAILLMKDVEDKLKLIQTNQLGLDNTQVNNETE